MTTRLNPYLNFKDNTRQAMEFYKGIFGGKLAMDTYKDMHMSGDPSEDNKIMHAHLETPGGLSFMAADTPNSMEFQPGTNFSMTLSGENEPELRGYFEKLSRGGTIIEPLEKAPWGDTFGTVVDPYGIRWMVNISGSRG